MSDLPLTKVSETSNKITFSYPKAADAEGYRYYADGVAVSRTFDPNDLQVTFGKVASGKYAVVPLDVVERQDRYVWPAPTPPPTGFASPLGYLDNHLPGRFPSTRLQDYGVIQSAGPAPTGFRGHNILYRTSITCGVDTYNNMKEAECIANNWYLRDASGPLYNTGFGGVLGDPGIPAYQQRWAELTLARLQEHGAEGFWADDSSPTVYFISGNRRPTKYPTDADYANALLSFCQFQQNYFGSRGYTTGYNSLIPMDDNASQLTAWIHRLGQANAADIITAEYWLARGDGTPPDGYLRGAGTEWFNNWIQWRGVHQACNQHGIGFFPLDEDQGNAYTLGSFMLDWDGNKYSSHAWRTGSGSDWWISEYGQAIALGLPTGPAVANGTVYTRPFQHGNLRVDSFSKTATFSVT